MRHRLSSRRWTLPRGIKVVELIHAVIASDGVIADEERAFSPADVERFGLDPEHSESGGEPS